MLESLRSLTHVMEWLPAFIDKYGTGVYGILCLIIFAETGLVVTPFLPGDSLLFAAGAVSATGSLNPLLLGLLLITAAIVGDSSNYWIGRFLGPRMFSQEKSKFFNKKHLDKTQAFYEKHGTKTIIMARFVPIVRTFAPFVAGIGNMPYRQFVTFSILGNIAWVSICVAAGYRFGRVEFVQKHFELVVVVIVLISLLPVVLEIIKHRREAKHLG